MFKKSLVLVAVILALCFGFAACSSDIKDLKARIEQLEKQLETAQGLQGPQGVPGEQGPQGPMGGGLVGNPTPDKVYQLGETVTYYSNGLKLFDITVTNINDSGDGRTIVIFTFTSYAFIQSPLENSLGAHLLDNTTETITNDAGISEPVGNTKRFVFNILKFGQQTLYICISCVDMYIPFAVYNLNLIS